MSQSKYEFLDPNTPDEVVEEIEAALKAHPKALACCEEHRVADAIKIIQKEDRSVAFKFDMFTLNGACA